MSDDASSGDDQPSFSSPRDAASSPHDEAADRPGGDQSPSQGAAPSMKDRSSFALGMARMWIQEHQEAAMLGAFAAGVFVGSLFRD